MTTSTKILGPLSVAGAAVSGDKPQTTVTVPSPQTAIEPLIVKSQTLGLTDDPPMGLSEQGSATYLSSGNPCLDFFFHIVPSTSADKLADRLNLAWAHDPLTALKLICNLRGVRGTGKSDKEGFYAAALWLYTHHPKTLSLNARAVAEFGYFKDFVEILYRILEGLDVRKKAELERREERAARVMAKRMRRYAHMYRHDENEDEEDENSEAGVGITQKAKNSKKSVDKETARAMRKEREAAKAAKALNRYNSDSNYRLLFDSIADLFADLLKSDIEALKPKDYSRITLAAKWCPSIDSSYDKSLLICEAIARRIFPKNSEKEYESMEESHYAYRVRDRLRKEILVPLRKALQIPEVYMSAREWNSLPYGRVPSVAMKNYKELFVKHDKERFEEYLEKVKTGKAKIAAGALLPHEIIAQLNDSDDGAVAELQWARVVEDMKKQGKLSNCIAVCDVSGSMFGTPMEVCVALGLLVSELSEEPWKGKVITFSEDPEMHLVEGETLKEKTDFIRRMDWGGSTNFYKVFDKMLDTAVSNNLREDQLVKRVFVFSDMEFKEAYEEPYSYPQHHYYGGSDDDDNDYDDDENEEEEEEKEVAEEAKAENRSWETDYQAIQRKFGEKGYNRVPEIVFWNLRDSSATPVAGTQNGVALVSGFSKNLLTMFMDGDGIVNPEDVMALAIAGEEYKKLVVFD
ncbi:unnamed protein product [Linum tenue]|uniref:Uncharacterized protein n=1 Tax=Linum tenue TaxID=586396 RepID=A0AAV0RN13_9ROSI|nr:unnamed protein product [Linum tenue]